MTRPLLPALLCLAIPAAADTARILSALDLDAIAALVGAAVAQEREACADVIHEEQANIWTQEIMEALAMNGHIDPQTYDDKVEIARLIRDELEVIPAAIRARVTE
jgi:hypothetical protein